MKATKDYEFKTMKCSVCGFGNKTLVRNDGSKIVLTHFVRKWNKETTPPISEVIQCPGSNKPPTEES